MLYIILLVDFLSNEKYLDNHVFNKTNNINNLLVVNLAAIEI